MERCLCLVRQRAGIIQTCLSRMDCGASVPAVQLPDVQVQVEPAPAPVRRLVPLRGTDSMQRNGSAMFMSTPELQGNRPVSFNLTFVPPKSHDPTPLVRRVSEDLHRRQNNND